MLFLLLTLASIQFIEGSLLRLGKQYLFQDSLNLTFHCDTNLSNLTQIIINSDNKCNIQSENNFTQIGSDDNHCITQTILELYMLEQCQTSMTIICNGHFSIVQTLYNPIELEKTYITNLYTITRTDLIQSLTFSIHEEELLIILLENELELLDSYRIILTRLDDPSNELELQQSNIKTYFQVLNKGRYQLFIIGQLFYNIYFQNQLISEDFIFSKSETTDYQNMTFITKIGQQLKAYFILHQGECEIKSIYNKGQEILYLREGIYLIIFQNLQIRIISQPLVIAIIYIYDTILFYPTNLFIVNHVQDTMPYIWSKYNIRIHPMDQQIQVTQTYIRDIQATILTLKDIGIYEFRIELEIVHINTVDVFQLKIPNNVTLICTCNLEEYSFKRISGKFQYQYANQELQIQTSRFTTLKFTKKFLDVYDLMLNKVYKIQSSSKFRVINVKKVYLKVFTYPEIDIRAYYDYQQKHKKEFINGRIEFEYDKPQYTYLVATSDLPFYIYIFSFQDSNFQVPKVMLRLTYLVFLNEIKNFQVITPSKSLSIIETNNGNFTSFQFDQENSLACLIQYWDQRYIQININELQYIDKGKSYVIYFQQDILLIVLESQIDSFELQIEIIKTDVNQLPRLSKDYQASLQEYPFKDECFKISLIRHMYLGLSFFECQQLDCILKIKNNNRSTNIQFLTCVEAELGLIKVQEHLFTCYSLFDKDILHIKGQISIHKAANYIHCKSENCLVLIIDANRQILENLHLDSFIQINQVYRNLSHNEFIFYNNQNQIIKIHTDSEWSVSNINEMKIDIMFELAVGYFYLTFTQGPSYIVIFTVPKRLYENLTYTFTKQEEFIIFNNTKKWLILEFNNSSDIELSIDNRRELIIGTLVQSIMPTNKTIPLIGNGTFMVYYVDSICYFLEEPKVLVLYNKTIKIEIQLNDDCKYQFIELQLDNSTFKQITRGNSFQIDSQYLQSTNELQYDILSNKILQLVKTAEYMYHFNYKVQLESSLTSTHFNIIYLAFISLLILILHKIIKFHRQDNINACQMINQDQKQMQSY